MGNIHTCDTWKLAGGLPWARCPRHGSPVSPHAVVVMCMHSVLLGGEEQRVLLEKAEDMGMTDGTYVFIPYDALTFPLPYQRVPYPVLANSTKLRLAYDAVLTITIDSPDVSFHEALHQAQEAYEIPAHINPMQVVWEPQPRGSGGSCRVGMGDWSHRGHGSDMGWGSWWWMYPQGSWVEVTMACRCWSWPT